MLFAPWLLLFLVPPAATVAPVATSAALLPILPLPSVVVPVSVPFPFPFPLSISFALTFYLNRRRVSLFVPFVFTLGTVRSGAFLLTAATPSSGLLFGHFECKVYKILNVYEKKNNAN